ncbi:hypothetical protein SLS53_001624 [Cytospora paraplurivora]|uniref:NADH:ubiquinone oxidoreductase intermediate-associated protein 30 domain-containing protein n=1 Tax=Cytospora paraplurivora TaxID=2898453 RepID=A0AAN9UIX5_9PEZI
MFSHNRKYLFGGDKPWDAAEFTSSDDRVRGGKSQSYLTPVTNDHHDHYHHDDDKQSGKGPRAEFSGNLDITALGGAGFASQRTVDGFPGWDLSSYNTLVIDVAHGDDRKYTVTLKDEVLPKMPDGREQSTISWEYDFIVGGDGSGTGIGENGGSQKLVIPFREFKPTYRGKAKPDAEPLDLTNVKRFSFMMRSFFGAQEGDFSLVLNYVAAEKHAEDTARDHSMDSVDSVEDAKMAQEDTSQKSSNRNTSVSWIARLCGWSR